MTQRQGQQNQDLSFNFLSLEQNGEERTVGSHLEGTNYGRSDAVLYDKSSTETKALDTTARLRRSLRVANTSSHMVSRSDTFNDGRQDMRKPTTTPRWQSRWETAMRPDPHRPQRRYQRNMSIHHVTETPGTITSVTSKEKPKRRDSRTKPRARRRGSSLVPDKEQENEQFERTSVKSTEVDKLQMLHKTWARSDNICTQSQRLWKFDTERRTNLFLSDDAFIKDLNMTEIVPLPGEYEENKRRRRFIRIQPAKRK